MKAQKPAAAVYCYDGGRYAGFSTLAVAAKTCTDANYLGNLRHVFLVAEGQPEAVCECGKFRCRLLARCPTCEQPNVQVFEVAGAGDQQRTEER